MSYPTFANSHSHKPLLWAFEEGKNGCPSTSILFVVKNRGKSFKSVYLMCLAATGPPGLV